DCFVGVAALGALRGVRAEPEEAPGQGAAIAGVGAPERPFVLDDAAARDLMVVDPPPPVDPVVLLALRRVAEDDVRELLSSLVAEVDVGDRHPSAQTDLLLEEEDRRDEAADQEPLEDVALHQAGFGEVAPALSMFEVLRLA